MPVKGAAQARATAAKASARPAPGCLASRPFAAQPAQAVELPRQEPEKATSASAGPSFSFGKLALQPRLTVGRSDDPFEQEADQVAERVMRMPEPSGAGGVLQRKCPSCAEEDKLQRKTAYAPGAEAVAPPIVHDVLRSPGQPLDRSVRSFMEPRFLHDFGDVRIHTDALAARSAEAVRARAYTIGRNVVFRHGEYGPETTKGRRLLAHELAHVAQQQHGATTIRRMAACPATLADDAVTPSGWRPYPNQTGIAMFHCGFRTILENRHPTPEDPENECVYDHSGILVDEHHPFAGCRGTPDQYDQETDPLKHGFIDSGGPIGLRLGFPVLAGVDAFVTSRSHDIDDAIAAVVVGVAAVAAAPLALLAALGKTVATGVYAGIATCDPGNWTFEGLPARSVLHLSVMGAILGSTVLSGTVQAVAGNLARRLDSFPITNLLADLATDINQALARKGSNLRVDAATLGQLPLYMLIDWLETQGLVHYKRPPVMIAQERMAARSPAPPSPVPMPTPAPPTAPAP